MDLREKLYRSDTDKIICGVYYSEAWISKRK